MMRVKTHLVLFGLLTSGMLGALEFGFTPFSPRLADARSSGGRSRGGSFKRSTPRRSSSPSSRPRSRTQPRRVPSYSPPRRRDWNRRPSAIPIPVPIPDRRYPRSSYPSNFDPRNNLPVIPETDSIGGALLDDAIMNNGEQSAEAFTKQAITKPEAQAVPNTTGAVPNTEQAANPGQTTAPNNRNQTIRNDSNGSGSAAWLLLPGAAIVGGTGVMLYAANKKKKSGGTVISSAAPGSAAEINNDILTISKVQVALLANSPIQTQLSQIVETMAIETSEQLKAQMQAVVVSLLRLPEYWSHAKVESQTVPNRAQAESMFEQWSMRERSKLSAETLTRDSFGVRESEVTVDPEEDPAAYVVVTLLLGTTHDRPLFATAHSANDVQGVLEKLSALSTPELLTFEFIWSPQDAADSLTRDELTTEYSDLMMV